GRKYRHQSRSDQQAGHSGLHLSGKRYRATARPRKRLGVADWRLSKSNGEERGIIQGQHMRRFVSHLSFVAVAVALTSVACGSSPTTTPTTPVTSPTLTTETFTGTINPANAHTYPFVSGAGTITLTLTSVAPDATTTLGI